MFDIDHFKKVNDTYGHLAGDRVLVAVAAAARRALREGDVLVRYGGEEFVAVLPGASLDDAAQIAERIRHACADLEIQDAGAAIRVTLSAGVTSWPMIPAKEELEVVRRADEALYAAKNAGRNRVVRAHEAG